MRAVKGVGRGTLPSDSAYVEIMPILPAGNPALKDIRELEPSSGPSPVPLIVGTLVGAVLLGMYIRRRRRRPLPITSSVAAQPAPEAPSAYAVALDQLDQIEGRQWPAHGEVARHYEMAVDTLRGYLEAAEDLPARERTTGEVLWSLPPHLAGDGLRDRAGALLDEADLVKFARMVPSPAAAGKFLERCRSLLDEWHTARSIEEVADAAR
jgi:MYXO-CTERM domain-containing protein